MPVTWLYRGTDAPGSQLLPAVRAATLPPVEYAWLCGESAIATGYWKLGQARLCAGAGSLALG